MGPGMDGVEIAPLVRIDFGLGGKVDHGLGANCIEGRGQLGEIGNVAFQPLRRVPFEHWRLYVIVDGREALLLQHVHDVGADESRSAGDKNGVHDWTVQTGTMVTRLGVVRGLTAPPRVGVAGSEPYSCPPATTGCEDQRVFGAAPLQQRLRRANTKPAVLRDLERRKPCQTHEPSRLG